MHKLRTFTLFFKRPVFFTGIFLILLAFNSCTNSKNIASFEDESLFSLKYGNFNEELNLFDLQNPGNVNTRMTMRGGFFYIVNGESKKIMEMSSYGDLLTLYCADEQNTTTGANAMSATFKTINYPFNEISLVTTDSRKCLYVVDKLPVERREEDENTKQMLTQIILRFDSDGNFINYIGQQGQGGTPFPVISNIYTTEQNELVVVTKKQDGLGIYWYSDSGKLRYTIDFNKDTVPNPHAEKLGDNSFMMISNAIPDSTKDVLYLMVNYYSAYIDEASRVQAGIDYDETLIYPIQLEDGTYDKAITIPPYTQEIFEGFTKITHDIPYDFIGITRSGWFYFLLSTETGFQVQMVQINGQRIIKRALPVNHSENLYFAYSLSDTGILSALLAKKDKVNLVWWRTDQLIDDILSVN